MHRLLLPAALLVASLASGNAGTIFSADFNGYSGNQNASQVDTGFAVAFGGSVSGWVGSGTNAVHAVNQGAGDWAIMFYADNTLTLASGLAANDIGTNYTVQFDYGTGTYNGSSQDTNATDGLIVEVLLGDNTVVAQQNFLPGAWATGNFDLEGGLQGTLTYAGNGAGDVRILIETVNPGADRFGGSIDNIVLTGQLDAPEPGGASLVGLGLGESAIAERFSPLHWRIECGATSLPS